MADSIEKLICGRIGEYVLVREIGRATHYTIFQAVDPRSGRMVFIKMLHVLAGRAVGAPPDAAAEAEGRESAHALATRLRREAGVLERLSHPNIPEVYEIGEHEGIPYLVTEYLYGQPLRQRLDRGPLPIGEAVEVLERVADALDAVHAHDFLHRDLRASAVILLNDGRVKLTEFGMARQPQDVTVTLMGATVGEPAYHAPERLRDQPASRASDIWSLGVLLYEMLAGRPPFEGSSFPLVAHQVLMGAPPPVPGVSPAVQAVLDRALEKDPSKRYGAAGELARDLRRAAKPALEAAPSIPRFSTRTNDFSGPAAIAAGAALALAVFALIGFFLSRPAPRVSRAALAPRQTALPEPPSSRIYATSGTFGTPPVRPDPLRTAPPPVSVIH